MTLHMRLAAAGLAITAILMRAAPAFAHITVDPREAAKRSLAKLTFRVPNERDDAGTTRVEIVFPEDHPIANVLVKPQPRWTYTVERGEPATPVQAHGEQITEVVQRIIWEGGSIDPGQFDEFEIYAGPLPEDADQLMFPALQTYSSGEVVRWIEEPAPVLQLVDAADSHGLMMQEAQEDRSPAGRPGSHRLLPIAGSGVAVAAVLAHFGGGAVLMHVGLPAVLVYLGGGAVLAYLGGGALVVGIVAVVVMMPLLVFGARRWLRHR